MSSGEPEARERDAVVTRRGRTGRLSGCRVLIIPIRFYRAFVSPSLGRDAASNHPAAPMASKRSLFTARCEDMVDAGESGVATHSTREVMTRCLRARSGPTTKRKGASSVELSFLEPLYTAVATVIAWIHTAYSVFIPPDNGLNWALTIITLTVLMRLLIFPLFLKQMRSSKKMQELAPKVQELRKRYKNDKQRMNQEVMEVYQGRGPTRSVAASRGGAVPDLHLRVHRAQAIAEDKAAFGMTQQMVDSARAAHIFGAPIPATFFTSSDEIIELGADPSSRRSSLPSSSRSARYHLPDGPAERDQVDGPDAGQPHGAAAEDPYVHLAAVRDLQLNFALGLILYWVTTNLWTLGQQHWFYSRHPCRSSTPRATWRAPSPSPRLLSRILPSKAAKEPQDAPTPEPEEKVVRQQPTRQPRSKRTGSKKP